jgi:protein TonB
MARLKLSREMGIAVLTSVAVHAVWLVRDAGATNLRVNPPSEVLLEAYEAPPPTPAPQPEEIKPVENQKPEPIVQKNVAKLASPATALPAAAQAGKTLTADDDAAGDVADFTMVQGTGTEYVGGTTSSIGTSAKAVRGPATAVPPPPRAVVGTRNAAAVGPDLSRSPRPSGPDWNCSYLFPKDPDAGDYATVSIVVTVGIDGTPKSVAVLRDPGHGFGAAARTCAMSQRYAVGLDRQGSPTLATTPPITVRFTR